MINRIIGRLKMVQVWCVGARRCLRDHMGQTGEYPNNSDLIVEDSVISLGCLLGLCCFDSQLFSLSNRNSLISLFSCAFSMGVENNYSLSDQ